MRLFPALGLLLLALGSRAEGPAEDGSGPLRVGAYHNPPKVFLDRDGQLSGIFGDLLAAVAEREGWTIEPVSCAWDECLRRLEAGELDLMPDVALSPEREERFAFHQVPALLSWSQIYIRPDEPPPASTLELGGRRVAVLDGSVQQAYLRKLSTQLDEPIDWLEVDSLEDGFVAVRRQRADVVVANQFFGDLKAREMGLRPAPAFFQASRLYFAASPQTDALWLERIDHHLGQWRNSADSVYFDILERWQPRSPVERVPSWLWWTLAGLLAALLAALAFTLLLRRQVAWRTAELRESEHRLNTILDGVDANIYIKGQDHRYQYVNRSACEWLGLAPGAIVGRRDEDFFDAKTCRAWRDHDRRVLLRGERFANEELGYRQGDSDGRTFLSIKLPLRDRSGRIYGLCGISTDITQLREIQAQLHQLASFDPLTGLPNRTLVLASLYQALARSAESGHQGALILLNLDHFKTVNDALGHRAGDELLAAVATRLREHLRTSDILGRMGADEFALVLEDLPRQPDRAEQTVRELAGHWFGAMAEPFHLGEQAYVINMNLGVVLFADAPEDTETLLRGVDLALQKAKREGPGGLAFFRPGMETALGRRTQLEGALRRALEERVLRLHLQPQVDSRGRVQGMEALARWHDTDLGAVSPGEFIPVAEATGLIIPLGRWVLDSACRMLARWRDHPERREWTLAVNISPAQFRHPAFATDLEATLRHYGCPPQQLELEITEGLLIDELDQTIERMTGLHRLGVRFALDDFGTGYASLSYLKRLPLQLLKIDQSFVRDLLTDPNDEAIVRTIIALARNLELEVLAEGVETEAQADKLVQLGCDYFQGFWYGRPAPEADD